MPVGISRNSGASEIPVANHDPVRHTLGNCSPRHGEELQQALRDVERSAEERRIRFDLVEPNFGAAVTSGSSRGGEGGGEIKSETVPSPVSDTSLEEKLRVQTTFINIDSSRLPRISGFHPVNYSSGLSVSL